MIEEIPDEDEVSRHVDSPHKFNVAEQALIDFSVFEFPAGQPESLIWRKYANTLPDVHAIGCQRQKDKRLTKPNWTYQGAITTKVGAIRAIFVRGHGFSVDHAPEEGEYHVHISYRPAAAQEFNKKDKMNLKEHLRVVFSPLDSHSCP